MAASAFWSHFSDIWKDFPPEKFRIKAGEECTLKAYRSYYTVFQINLHPGKYIFLGILPLLRPSVFFILGNWTNINLDPEKIKKKRNRLKSIDYMFPKIKELAHPSIS